MKALVTGGAGFIGSNLVRRLVSMGASVRVLDNESTGSVLNLQDVSGSIDYIFGDIRREAEVARAVEDVEVVFHLAALPSVARSVKNPLLTNDVNVNGTLNVLWGALQAGATRVVYASSSSVYGNTPALPKQEDMAPSPRSPYATAKLAGEAYCRAWAFAYGLHTVSLRFFNVFGPNQDPDSDYAAVIPLFATRIMAGKPPLVQGDGLQTRDFTYVANAVDACVLAALSGPESSGEAMNVGCDRRYSLLELIGMLGEITGRTVEPEFVDPRPGDVRDSQADIAKAQRLIGYRPEVDFRTGLVPTVEWCSKLGAQQPV